MATVPSFAPATSAFLSAGPTSAAVAIPSGGSILAVTNVGDMQASVAIDTVSTLAVAFNAGFPVLPGQTEFLTIGTNTTLAAVTALRWVGLNLTSGN